METDQLPRLKRTTDLDSFNLACTNNERTRLQFKEAIYNLYFQYHPMSGSNHLTPELPQL
eukprot:3667494-Amphidinium_carterae.1